jgi:hypothetical protein
MDYLRTLFIGGPKDGEIVSVLNVPTCIMMADGERHEYERRRVVLGPGVVEMFVLKGMDDGQALGRISEFAAALTRP